MNAATLAVLRAIHQLTEQQHGQPPSLREIARAVPVPAGTLGLRGSSTTRVHYHIQKLVNLGLVTRWPRRARTMTLTLKGKEEASK